MTTSLENLGNDPTLEQDDQFDGLGYTKQHTDEELDKIHDEEVQKKLDKIPSEIAESLSFDDSPKVRREFLRENSVDDLHFFERIRVQWIHSNGMLTIRELAKIWYGIDEHEFNKLQDNFSQKFYIADHWVSLTNLEIDDYTDRDRALINTEWIFMPDEEALKMCYLGWEEDDYECSTFLEYMEKESNELGRKWIDRITELGVDWDNIPSTSINVSNWDVRPLDVYCDKN